jgi:hypothetical protein
LANKWLATWHRNDEQPFLVLPPSIYRKLRLINLKLFLLLSLNLLKLGVSGRQMSRSKAQPGS